MKIFNSTQLRLTFNTIKASKLRNFWTMLGVILGVSGVILIVGVGEGVKHQLVVQNKNLGNDLIVVSPTSIRLNGSNYDSLSFFSGLNVNGSLSNNDYVAVSNTKGVGETAPLSAMTAKISGNQTNYPQGLVIGTNQNLMSMLNQKLQYGSFLLNDESSDQGVVVGFQAARELFSEDNPLGNSLYINNRLYFVRGVLNPINSTPLGNDGEFNKAVFISYPSALDITNNTITTYQILAKPTHIKDLNQVTTDINSSLLNLHGGQQNFLVTNSKSPNSSSASLELLTRMVIGLAAIALVIGGIGIMNVMLVAVTERMHEIGIRKAVGATNRQIIAQFLSEAMILSTFGGIIGIGFAFLIDLLMRMFTNLRPVISWQVVVLSFVVSILIGVVFGTIPAVKAAAKQPIDALRSE